MHRVKVGDWVEVYKYKRYGDNIGRGLVVYVYGHGDFHTMREMDNGDIGMAYTNKEDYLRHLSQHEIVVLKLGGITE